MITRANLQDIWAIYGKDNFADSSDYAIKSLRNLVQDYTSALDTMQRFSDAGPDIDSRGKCRDCGKLVADDPKATRKHLPNCKWADVARFYNARR